MKKLSLNKETIARLDNPDKIFGGETHGYVTTIVQEWLMEEDKDLHSDNYCGIRTADTNCSCYCATWTCNCPPQTIGQTC